MNSDTKNFFATNSWFSHPGHPPQLPPPPSPLPLPVAAAPTNNAASDAVDEEDDDDNNNKNDDDEGEEDENGLYECSIDVSFKVNTTTIRIIIISY